MRLGMCGLASFWIVVDWQLNRRERELTIAGPIATFARWAEVRAFAAERKLPWPLETTLDAAFEEWARVWQQSGIKSTASAMCNLTCFHSRVFKNKDVAEVGLAKSDETGVPFY